jgi:hypothetical protein
MLSYHLIFIPLVPLAVLGVFFLREPGVTRCLLAGFGGLVLGIVLNPHFPGSLEWLWLILLERKSSVNIQYGAESRPLGSVTAALNFAVPFALILMALKASVKNVKLRLRVFTALAFTPLFFMNARAMEYWVPASVLVAPEAWAGFKSALKPKKAWVMLVVLFCIQGICAIPVIRSLSAVAKEFPILDDVRSILQVVPKGEGVVNGNWDSGGYIFYLRPDLRTLDLLDPYPLLCAAPELYLLREELRDPRGKNWKRIFSEKFHARYLLLKTQGPEQYFLEATGFSIAGQTTRLIDGQEGVHFTLFKTE